MRIAYSSLGKLYLMKVVILIAVQVFLCEARVYTTVLNSDNGDPWGTWRIASFCPEESWAIGFSVKYEDHRSHIDDTALNGIKLMCSTLEYRDTGVVAESFSGNFGNWKPAKYCPGHGYLTGFRLQVEKPQGSGDDTGADGVGFGCSETGDSSVQFIEFRGQYGTWGQYTACPAYTAICGIQNKVEEYGGKSVDDTSVDDIKLFCCPTDNVQIVG